MFNKLVEGILLLKYTNAKVEKVTSCNKTNAERRLSDSNANLLHRNSITWNDYL